MKYSCALFVLLGAGSLPAAMIALPQASYGHVDQANITGCTSDTGINNACGPTSLLNSYYWLQNTYSTVYGTMLIPHSQGNSTLEDQQAVADHLNCVSMCNGNGGGTVVTDLIAGDMQYIESVVPNVTYYTQASTPSFNYLFSNLSANADVEILIGFYTPDVAAPGGFRRTGGHYVTVTGISSALNDGNGTINFVDPNGGANMNNIAIQSANGYLYANGNVYGTGAGNFSIIEYGLTENAIPEPGTWTLCAGVIFAVLLRKRVTVERALRRY